VGGKVYSMELEYGTKRYTTPNLNPEEMELDIGYINKLLGLELKENDTKKLLERMGYGYNKGKVLIPAYRADILHQSDLAEDIAIAYGYENFQEEIPKVSTIATESEKSKFNRKISEILVGLGLLECSSFSLSNEVNLNKKMNVKNELFKVESPVNTDYNTLRNWIIPSLMQILSENKRHEYPQKIFEIGKIFKGIQDLDSLGIVITSNFTEIKQTLDVLFTSLALEYETTETNHPSFIPGRVGKILVKGKEIGILGELHPSCLTNWNIEMPCSSLELNISDLFELK